MFALRDHLVGVQMDSVQGHNSRKGSFSEASKMLEAY